MRISHRSKIPDPMKRRISRRIRREINDRIVKVNALDAIGG
jgi:hypothetical protein